MLDRSVYLVAAWACAAVLGGAVALEAAHRRWHAALYLAIFLVLAVGFLLARRRLPSLFALAFTLAALVNGAGWAFGLWHRMPGYDEFAHAFTTFAAALAVGFVVLHTQRVHFARHGAAFALTIAAYGLALGAGWELFEWATNLANTYRDTVMDLAMDGLGALAAGLAGVWAVRTQPPGQLHA